MSLIATARALDDQRFLWRVRAAMLDVAKSTLTREGATSDEIALANLVIDSPMSEYRSMEALVASSTKVSTTITVDQFNTVSTEDVLDSDIISAVKNSWTLIAKRYIVPQEPQTL